MQRRAVSAVSCEATLRVVRIGRPRANANVSNPSQEGVTTSDAAWVAAADRKLRVLGSVSTSRAGTSHAAHDAEEAQRWAEWEAAVEAELRAHRALVAAASSSGSGSGSGDSIGSDSESASTSVRIGDPKLLHPLQVRSFDPLPAASLDWFPPDRYHVSAGVSDSDEAPAALMVHHHVLLPEQVPDSVCCVSRFGSGGFANVPVGAMTERGIPVFTTPSANANAVKEAVVCALMLASRGVLEGAAHARRVISEEGAKRRGHDAVDARLRSDRHLFLGTEVAGKTLGVIGLGNVGSLVARAALDLDMSVIGYDPWLTPDTMLRLPGGQMTRADSLEQLLRGSDYISVHVHYFNVATHHLLNSSNLGLCRPNVHLINFSPARVIDGEAVRDLWDSGRLHGKYVSDFADPHLQGHPRHLVLPHLGALTQEAATTSATSASSAVSDFLSTGAIRQSVNFPAARLERMEESSATGRLCIVVQSNHEPGILGRVNTFLESAGITIETQISATKGEIAYLILDVANVADASTLQAELCLRVRRVVSSRYIDYSSGGAGKRSTYAASRTIWRHEEVPDFEVADWQTATSEGSGCEDNSCTKTGWVETWPDSE
ncbi:hypothetical protein FOA52_005312 [Chlamydomonas sp. UWO 241]|nr:hypothetical protein FOA52_005312 [Chlamydomonas sp. UWO 241]